MKIKAHLLTIGMFVGFGVLVALLATFPEIFLPILIISAVIVAYLVTYTAIKEDLK